MSQVYIFTTYVLLPITGRIIAGILTAMSVYNHIQVRRDGTKMSLAQSKKLSQLTADNAQWEDRQLLRSGAVRGTEVQTEFDNEEERKVILLVHGMEIYGKASVVDALIYAFTQLYAIST